jgi:SAM-dependent methyltransferase
VEGYGPGTYGDGFADVYDDWYAGVTDVDACVERVAELVRAAGGGPVLELGVGSGRLALPLAGRGLEVHGVDASGAMLDRLRAHPQGASVRAVLADMADLDAERLGLPTSCAVVLVAFNTLFNLPAESDQRGCLAGAARLLAPAGRLVVEAFVPGDDAGAARRAVEPTRIGIDEVVLTVSQVDPAGQTVTGQHVQITERGIRLRPWHLRWATPAQLDEMAAGAGLRLERRDSGWSGEPFDDASAVHVSVYRLVE